MPNLNREDMIMKKQLLSAMMVLMSIGAMAMPAFAYDYHAYQRQPYYQGYNRYDQSAYNKRQYIQKAVIGGAAGAALGGILNNTGDVGGGAIRGGLIGAGVGLGYQYLKTHHIF